MGYEVRFGAFQVTSSGVSRELSYWVRRMEPFFSPLTGIINYYYVAEVGPGDPQLFFSSARLHRMSYHLGMLFDPQVGGIGETAEEAFLSACGEAVERYASSVVPVKQLPLADYETMMKRQERVVSPDKFMLYASWQYEQENFAYDPFLPSSLVRWVKGISLVSGDEVWVPAAFVYMPYMYKFGQEARINHTTSTGLAFHFVPSQAWKTGLCEVVERDAFALTWWARLTPDELDLDSVDDERVRRLLDERLGAWKKKIRVFSLPTDTRFPVFLGLIEEDDERAKQPSVPALCVGAAASLDVATALYKVIIEVVQTYKFASYLKQQNEKLPQKRVFEGKWNEEIRDFSEGVLCYSYPQWRKHLSFLKGEKRISFRDLCQQKGFNSLEEACAFLQTLGFEALVVDITPLPVDLTGKKLDKINKVFYNLS